MPIKTIKGKLPENYEVQHWIAEDRAGKHKMFVPTFLGKALFGQNVTFGSLGDARKKARQHHETQQQLKRVRELQDRIKRGESIGNFW